MVGLARFVTGFCVFVVGFVVGFILLFVLGSYLVLLLLVFRCCFCILLRGGCCLFWGYCLVL